MKTLAPMAQRVRVLGDQWLDAATRRPATQRVYRLEIERFIRWLSASGVDQKEQFPDNLLVDYLDDVASGDPEAHARTGVKRALKLSSVLQTKRILAALLMWAAETGQLPLWLATQARRWQPSVVSDAKEREPPRPEHRVRVPTSEEGRARREFVAALSYWTGASPQQIARLKRRSIRVDGDVLQVRLPDGKGQETVSFGPPAMVQMWRRLKKLSCTSDYAIVRCGRIVPVSASTIARELRQIRTLVSGTNSRTLRQAGVTALRAQGWPEALVLRQYRRHGLAQPRTLPTSQQIARLMSQVRVPMIPISAP